MTREDQKTSPSEKQAARVNEIVAAYSHMFLSGIDRKIDAHLNPDKDNESPIPWCEKDLV